MNDSAFSHDPGSFPSLIETPDALTIQYGSGINLFRGACCLVALGLFGLQLNGLINLHDSWHGFLWTGGASLAAFALLLDIFLVQLFMRGGFQMVRFGRDGSITTGLESRRMTHAPVVRRTNSSSRNKELWGIELRFRGGAVNLPHCDKQKDRDKVADALEHWLAAHFPGAPVIDEARRYDSWFTYLLMLALTIALVVGGQMLTPLFFDHTTLDPTAPAAPITLLVMLAAWAIPFYAWRVRTRTGPDIDLHLSTRLRCAILVTLFCAGGALSLGLAAPMQLIATHATPGQVIIWQARPETVRTKDCAALLTLTNPRTNQQLQHCNRGGLVTTGTGYYQAASRINRYGTINQWLGQVHADAVTPGTTAPRHPGGQTAP
ncbi:hypothetical protein [Silvimonas iriomotensis]|uniref:hypothetical protein n=1 Tax=Silvimonas iriomotensis TaxID=449662 RepID=UPI0016691ED4|nr:hypothetical protein [Silvimonas iriomotensis]